MADRVTYNPYGNSPTGMFIDRFQGVYNDGLGCNLQPSLVDYALDCEDQWRGAVKKRRGYSKHLTKGYPIHAFSNVFEGYYLQGDNDVWYRTDLLVDYRRKPGSGGDGGITIYPPGGYGGYTGGSTSGSADTFTGAPPVGASPYIPTGTDTWRFSHIAIAINQRLTYLGIALPDESVLPTVLPDSSITYIHINNARYYVETITPSFQKSLAVIQAMPAAAPIDVAQNSTISYGNYHILLETLSLGGFIIGVREWSNVSSTGYIVYRDNMNSADILSTVVYSELESALKALKHKFVVTQTLVDLPKPGTPGHDDSWGNTWPPVPVTFESWPVRMTITLGSRFYLGQPLYNMLPLGQFAGVCGRNTNPGTKTLMLSNFPLGNLTNLKYYFHFEPAGTPRRWEANIENIRTLTFPEDSKLGQRSR